MAGQVGGQQVSREELRARGRYSLTIASLFLLILIGAGPSLPRRAIVVVPIVLAIVVSVRRCAGCRGLRRAVHPVRAGRGSGPLRGAAARCGDAGGLLRAAEAVRGLHDGANTNTAQTVCSQQRQRSILGSLTEF